MIGRSVAVGTALVVAALLAPAGRVLGARFGLVDRPDETGALKIHVGAVPVTGGLVILAATFATLVLLRRTPPAWLVVGGCLVLFVGLVDDIRPLPVWVRLLLLGSAGVVLAPALDSVRWLAAAPVMAILVLATANAVNILDGQDGLAGGLVAVAALAFGASLPTGRPASWVGLALAGATLAFLAWNRPPARMFLGNGGAYSLGALLAVLAAVLVSQRGWEGLVVAGGCLIVFAFEVSSTLLRRWRFGRSLTGGDRVHSYDVLAQRVGSRGLSTIVFVLFGLAGWGLGVVLSLVPAAIGLSALAAVLLAAVVASTRLWSPPRGVRPPTGTAP